MGDRFRLDGRRILVTGATSDIGRAIAVACANAGASVIATGRNPDRLKITETALNPTKCQHVAVLGDLSLPSDIARVAESAGQVDGVVHAAAETGPMLARSVTAEYLQGRFNTNYFASMLLTRAQLGMQGINDGGSIVFVSSISAHAGTRGMSVYAATKASQVATARCLALEFAPKRVRVNCISPAIVKTSVYAAFGAQWLEEQAKRYPLGLGRPDDIAYATQFLLSDASRWITGQVLLLDGACAWI